MKQLVLMRGVPGAGKALDNNTIIPTPQGDKKISEIKEGDFLFDRKGNPTEVVGVFPQGKIKAYKVSLDDGSYFIVNDEHIIPYVTSRGNINSKTLKEIYKDYKKRDIIALEMEELLYPINIKYQNQKQFIMKKRITFKSICFGCINW
ncbi:terminase large subunit [Staphylococcus phage Alsa_4]|nr:terminase large subunit [Staphylococcus phage Alsa_4]